MRRWTSGLLLGGMLLFLPDGAGAQTPESDRIASQWRAAKRRELVAQYEALRNQIARIDAGATPDTLDPPAAPAARAASPVPPAPPTAVAATATAPGTPPPPAVEPASDPAAEPDRDKTPGRNFGGIDFGVGVSFTADLGTRDRISDAVLVNGLVRTVDQNNARARIMLESHYFFTPPGSIPGLGVRNGLRDIEGVQKQKEWGWGPFVAIQPGSDDVIEAIGLGVMIGFRRGAGDQSFNLGIGLVVDPNTRILGDDVFANKPLPTGETDIRFQERSQKGILILSSFSF